MDELEIPQGEEKTFYTPMNVIEPVQDQVMGYICSEIIEVRDGSTRKELEERWKRWRKQRMAIPESPTRDTPWIRAANVYPPLTMQKVHTVYAKLLAAFAVKKPPVSVEAFSPKDRDTAEVLERFFKGLADNKYGLDVRSKFKRIAYDVVSLGTQVIKVPFRVDQWAFKRTSDYGVEQVSYVRHMGPEIVPIPLEDFFTRPYWKDVQRAPWIGIRYRFFYHELLQKQSQGFFQNVDKVFSQPISQYSENKMEALRDVGIVPGSLSGEQANSEFEIYECNVFWDVDGDGIPEDIIVWVEPNTQTLLRAEYNPLSIRDVEVATYIDNPESLYGIGICQMVEGPQETLTTLQRMRLDGTQLNMMKMFAARRGAGLSPKEEFYPFKLMFFDDPMTDFRPIEFPDVSQGCLLGEQMAKEDADRVSGANDYMAGFNDKILGSNATASGTQFLAGQANSVLNSLLENMEQSMSTVYMLAFYQCIANKDLLDLSWMDDADRVALFENVFSLSVEDLPTKFKFTVRTTDINKTDESRKQSFLMATQLYNQYMQAALNLAQMLSNPQVAQNPQMMDLVSSMYVGQTRMAAKVLEFFDIGDPEEFLPFVEDIRLQQRLMDRQKAEQISSLRGQMEGGMYGSQGTQQEAGSPFTGVGMAQGPAGGPIGSGGVPSYGSQTGEMPAGQGTGSTLSFL